MAGYREFQTGEVLTAANVNSFLMEQATMTFADAAARDAALAGVLRAGLNVYLEDTDRLQYYDGTAWQNVPNESDVDAAGGLVAVKSAIFTGTQTTSVGGQASAAITDLDIAHAVGDASNDVYLFAQVIAAKWDGVSSWGAAAITAGGTLLNLGNADGSRTRVSAAQGNGFEAIPNTMVLLAKHTPGNTSPVTYGVSVINIDSVTRTLSVNRGNSDTNTQTRIRGASVLILAEVKV